MTNLTNRRERIATGDTLIPNLESFIAEFKRQKIRYLNLYCIALGEHYYRKATCCYGDKRYGCLLVNRLIYLVLRPGFIKQIGTRILGK